MAAAFYADETEEDAMATAACTPADMSESFTKEFLSCSICWDTYDDKARQPKLLSCHHTFCKSCLKKLLRSKTVLQCSTCRKDTTVPAGISSLQTNFYVMYMKQKFGEQLRANHNICYKHALQPLSFFCKTCTQMVCRDCIVLAHSRNEGHELQELNEVKAEYVYCLEQLRVKVDEGTKVRQRHLACLRTELDTMDIVKEVATRDIDKTFDQLVDAVNTRRQHLKDSMRETHEGRHRSVNEQLVDIDNQMNQLLAVREQLDDATCKGQLRDIVEIATDNDLHERVAAMANNQPLTLGNNHFTFHASGAEKSLQTFIGTIGEFRDTKMLPSCITLETEDAKACLETKITVTATTHTGDVLKSCAIGMEILDPAGDEISCETVNNHDGTYTIKFRPQISGAHLCTVKLSSMKISSSCISVAVQSNDPESVIGSMGKDEAKLMYPCSLKIDGHRNLYVVDEGNQRIQRFSEDGSVEIISVSGSAKNARTFDCAIDNQHAEIICSKVLVEQRKAWADTIQIYDLDGNMKHQFTNSNMKKALYVAVNSSQQIVVSDYHLNKLFIYSHDGTLVKEIGLQGGGPGEFREPAFVCIGKDDDIIISDCRNSRIQVLSQYGEFKYQIGSKGSGKGQLQGPSGVVTDEHGHILVTDRVNNRIQVYTYDGTFVSCIESSGDKLNDPRGLAVSADGYVYVADQKNHCIKQYKYL